VIEIVEEGVLHIHLSETAEKIIDVFNRAQTGELEPFAKYIEDGKPLTPDMRLFLAAYLRGELSWGKGPKENMDKIMLRNQRLRRMRDIQKETKLSEPHAIYLLSEEINMNEDTLKSQIRKAKEEEKGQLQIGPSYKDD